MVSDRIHGTFARESLDKVVLALAFVVGAAGTIWLKLADTHVLVVAFFPVVVLLFYVVSCLSLRSIGTEPETIGDNSYYLGFLFTLASLAITLFRIRDIGAADVDLIPMVISGFGVALTSTIAGVFARVFLLQLRPDIVARDRAARRDLSAGARDLRAAIADASRHLKNISVETQQHVAERNSLMSEVLRVQVEETSRLLERQAEAYDEIVREFARRLSKEVGEVMRNETKSATAEITAAAKSFRENLEAIGELRAEAEANLCAGLDGFRKVVDEVQGTTNEHRKVTEKNYRTLAARSAKISASFEEAAETVQEAISLSRSVVEEAQAAARESRASVCEEERKFCRHAEAVTRALGELETVLVDRVARAAELFPADAGPTQVSPNLRLSPPTGQEADSAVSAAANGSLPAVVEEPAPATSSGPWGFSR